MGKRKGRRTHSRDGGPHLRPPAGGPLEWPGLTGPSPFTFEGRMRNMGAVSSNLSRARGGRAAVARFLWLLGVPPLAAVALIQDVAYMLRRRREKARRPPPRRRR